VADGASRSDRSSALWRSLQSLTNREGVHQTGNVYRLISDDLRELWHLNLEDQSDVVRAKVIWQLKRLMPLAGEKRPRQVVAVAFNLVAVDELDPALLGQKPDKDAYGKCRTLKSRYEWLDNNGDQRISQSTCQRYLNSALDEFENSLRTTPPPPTPAEALPPITVGCDGMAEQPSASSERKRFLQRRLKRLYWTAGVAGLAVLLALAAWQPWSHGGAKKTGNSAASRSSSSAGSAAPASRPGSVAAAAPLKSDVDPNVSIQAQFQACDAVYLSGTPQQVEQNGTLHHPVQAGAVFTGKSLPVIEITAQTPSSEAIVLSGIHIRTLKATPDPTSGFLYYELKGCGGCPTVRPFNVDLDQKVPIAVAQPDPGTCGPKAGPPVTFPFIITPGDPEIFHLNMTDAQTDSTFNVEIDWVDNGRSGKTILDNGGKGYHLIGSKGLPLYTDSGSPGTLHSYTPPPQG
jgi:hypothetical protein